MPEPTVEEGLRQFYQALQNLRAAADLRKGLQNLRALARERYRESLLLDWGRWHLKLTPEIERQWFEQAWWGIFAGETVREFLQDPARRDQAIELFEPFDPGEVEAARKEYGGVILAGAHIGPPKTALHFLLDRPWALLIWTDRRGNPDWVQQKFGARFLDPTVTLVRQSLLAKSALHLRDNGVLFGTPDTRYGNQTLPLTLSGIEYTFSLGIPVLARRLGLPVFRFFTLWHQDRIRIECERIPSPAQHLDEVTWHRQWIDNYASRLQQLILTSPANLRYLLMIDAAALLPQIMI